MKRERLFIWASALVLGAAVVFVMAPFTGGWGLSERDILAIKDSLNANRAELDSLRNHMPGLGEYMTTMQLHAAKLWFAAKASNRELARYELDELNETMVAAEGLHAVKDSVNISNVLESVRETQLVSLRSVLEKRSWKDFPGMYTQTLAACNGCHRSSAHAFISIVIPSTPPVSNQRWDAH